MTARCYIYTRNFLICSITSSLDEKYCPGLETLHYNVGRVLKRAPERTLNTGCVT